MPNPRERYGIGVAVVVVGVTPHQGDGSAVHRAKRDRWSESSSHAVRVMRSAKLALMINRYRAVMTTGELLDTESGHEQF
jgi:hypothetical protein